MPVFRLGELTSDRSSIAYRRPIPLSSLRRPVAASTALTVERLLLRGKLIARLFPCISCISCISFVCGLSGIGCSIEYKGTESSSNSGSSQVAARGENPQPATANAGAPVADAPVADAPVADATNGPVTKTAPGEAASAQAASKKPASGEAPPGDPAADRTAADRTASDRTASDRTASSGSGERSAGREGASGASPAPTPADPSKSGATAAKRDILPIESTSRRAVVRENGLEVITFDDLNLGMQADMVFREFLLTDRARELDGKKVRLVGYMDGGVSQTKGIQEFVLLRNTECKFGPGGQADHLVRVLMKDGATADYSLNALQIEGVIKVNPFNGPDGNTWSVYDLIGEQVKTIRKK